MIVYSHRGNLNGAVPGRENDPAYVVDALAAGLHVEIDLRCIGDQLFLGHDFPQYQVTHEWITNRADKLLVHIKDMEALKYVALKKAWHYFCHNNDPFTMTSQGWIWLHELSLVPDNATIVPLISSHLVSSYPHRGMMGICSDYPLACQRMFT